jgi:oxygen-independent coproporphyrinogen-3 oxidase
VAPPQIQAIYIHIPFCHTICPFCAFAVHGSRPALHEPFLENLLGDIRLAQPMSRPGEVQSIYVGGGTPSTLQPQLVGRLFDALRGHFHFSPESEIAFEINPEDSSVVYFEALRARGVTRLSLAVQRLDDASLKKLGRNHTACQAADAFETANAAGFDNINIDLMFGVPDIQPGRFLDDVTKVAAWRPAHVSLYGLDIEDRTLFGRNPHSSVGVRSS